MEAGKEIRYGGSQPRLDMQAGDLLQVSHPPSAWLSSIHSRPFALVPTSLRIEGFRRLVGSLKLQVSFAEYSLFYRVLLQKRPMPRVDSLWCIHCRRVVHASLRDSSNVCSSFSHKRSTRVAYSVWACDLELPLLTRFKLDH